MKIKLFLIVLTVLLSTLQYKLWFEDGSITQAFRLKKVLHIQQAANSESRQRNQGLEAEVHDLKQGLLAIEERARNELGMVKEGETFYQVV